MRGDGDRRVGGEQQRVAIRRALRRDIGADGAARAAADLDHDRLVPHLRELDRHDASVDVGRSTRRKGDDHPDGLGRVTLGERGQRGGRDAERNEYSGQHQTCLLVYYFSDISSWRARSSAFFLPGGIFGYSSSSSSSASTMAAATTRRVYHLLSAGTTYHGACSVEVSRTMSS